MSDEVVYPVGSAILAMILGIPIAIPFAILSWLDLVSGNTVLAAWLVGGVAIVLWLDN